MKKLIILILMLPLLLTSASASMEESKEWWSSGVEVEHLTVNDNIILKATSTKEGFNILISPPIPINTSLKYSFSIKAENTDEVLAEIVYFGENKTSLFAKNAVFVGKGSFEWKRLEMTAVPFKKAKFSSLMIIIDGTGTVYIDNLTISEIKQIEKPSTEESINQTKTKNLQRLLIDDEDIRVEILLNKTYHPGDAIRADFYITNKKGVIDEVDIKLEVYYFGIKVFSYEHPSWREYGEGETIHIFHESNLPVITPPGEYALKFYITPVGRETKEIGTSITVKPNATWFSLVITAIAILSGILFLVKKYWKRIVKIYKEFSIGQRFVFFAIIGLIMAAIILAIGAENYANDVAIIVYYLLVVGVLNMWIEYIEPKWDREDVREIASVYLLALLMYLSRDIFTVYLAVAVFVIGTVVGILKLKGKKAQKKEKTEKRCVEP